MKANARYNAARLADMVREVFLRSGYNATDAETITDVLLTSDRMGIESHGLQRLVLYQYGISISRINVNAKPTIIKDTPLSVVIDANAGMGQIVSKFAMETAIEKARKRGIGIALVRNSNHFGIAGYYSLMAAKAGLLGITMTNTQALVVPTFGRIPLLGTNPIAVSMPAEPYPFHLDMATSVVTGGKMEVYAKNNEPLPEGWAVDANGHVNTDPQEFVRNRGKASGGLLPLGGAGTLYSGHKGYGLSLVVELMTGILSSGTVSAFVRKVKEKEQCCHMFAAIDYEMFTDDKAGMEKQFSEFLNIFRNSEKAAGENRIYIPGEKEFESMAHADERGIVVSEGTLKELEKICRDKGLNPENYIVEV